MIIDSIESKMHHFEDFTLKRWKDLTIWCRCDVDNAKSIPKGWEFSYGDEPLKIAVPTTAAFKEFVRVNYNHTDGPHISGFSISVFQAVASNLPYFLPYDFIPFNGPYDDLLKKVYTKVNLSF